VRVLCFGVKYCFAVCFGCVLMFWGVLGFWVLLVVLWYFVGLWYFPAFSGTSGTFCICVILAVFQNFGGVWGWYNIGFLVLWLFAVGF